MEWKFDRFASKIFKAEESEKAFDKKKMNFNEKLSKVI